MIDILATTPAEAADRLEAALAALGYPVDPEVEAALTDRQRTGAAAGILASTLMLYTIAAGVEEDGTVDMEVHHAMVQGLDVSAAYLREDILMAYLNVMQLWTLGEAMQQAIGPEVAMSAADHLEHVIDDLDGAKAVHVTWEADADAPTAHSTFLAGDERGAAGTPPDLMDEFGPPDPDPVRRLSRSCMALGVLPGIIPAADNEVADHPAFAVATLAGTLAGRSTMEMINANRTLPEPHRHLTPQLWSQGFTLGLVATPDAIVPDSIISGVMMRIVSLIGAWHSGAGETPRAQIVADLCRAAINAARSDGLAAAPIDEQAQYIAMHGIDTDDSHRDAIRHAEAAVIALKHLDII